MKNNQDEINVGLGLDTSKFESGINVVKNFFKDFLNDIERKTPSIETDKMIQKEKLSRTLSTLKKEIKEIDPDSEAFRIWSEEINKTENELKKLEKSPEKTNKSIKVMGNSMKKVHKSGNALSRLFGRIGQSIRRQIVYSLAAALNPLNLMKKTFSYLTDTLSPRLGATFKNIGNNLVEYFASSTLFKQVIEQILYLILQLQNAFNSLAGMIGLRKIDLFKTSAKSAKEMEKSASKTTASFDEINDIGNQGAGDDKKPLSLGELDLKDQSVNIIDGLNELINKFESFFKDFNFKNLGKTIGEKFTNVFTSIDWSGLAVLLVSLFTSMFDLAWGILEGTDWSKIGKTISDAIVSALEFVSNWLSEIDWLKLGNDTIKAVTDFFKSIDWNKIFDNLFKILGQAVGGLSILIGNLVDKIVDKIVNYFKQYIEIDEGDSWLEIGFNIIDGILEGIIKAIVGIGKWIWEHIFVPIWDGIKDAFGIHSPSTKMMEIGGYLIDGLKEGIGNIWEKIKSKFTDFKENIKTKFNEIKNDIGDKTSEWASKIKEKFSWNKVKSTFDTLKTNIKGKLDEIGKFKCEVTAKVKGDISDFKEKMSNILGDNNILSSVLNWTSSKIKSAKNWLASLDVGTNYVPNDQLAIVHKGEAVIPKKFNDREFFGTGNEDTNALLQTLIERVDNIELSPYIGVKDIGEASINYINNKTRITGRSVI